MPTPALLLSRLGFAGFAPEATQGTYVAPTLFVPGTAFKPEDVTTYDDDTSMEANAAKLQGSIQGVKESTYSLDANLYFEAMGQMLAAAGYADTVTGAGPYTHTFKMSAAQPASRSITDYNVYDTRGFVGQMLDQMDLTIDAKALIKFVAAFKGWPSATQTKPTPAYPATPAGHGWEVAYTVGGVAIPRIVSLGVTLKQNVDVIHTSNSTQSPYNVFMGEREASGKATGVFIDNTELNHFLTNDQPALVATITSPTGSPAPVLQITATKTIWNKATVDRSGKYNTGNYDIEFAYNSTDGGPCAFVLTNGTSTAYV